LAPTHRIEEKSFAFLNSQVISPSWRIQVILSPEAPEGIILAEFSLFLPLPTQHTQ